MKYAHLILFFMVLITSCNEPHKEDKTFPTIGYVQLENSQLEISEIVNDLEVPWDIEAAIQDKLWFTQVSGSVHLFDLKTGVLKDVFQVPDLISKKSYGLLGMTVDPTESFVFLHYTFAIPKTGQQEEIRSRLVRYEFDGETLVNPRILMDSLPGATFHNGSRIVISGDKTLFFSLGDVGKVDLSQNKDFFGGKVFRLNMDGSIPEDNPFPNSPVWAMGFRNTQGMAIGQNNQLYGSDHGPVNDDEVNLILKGSNYGWPDVQGFADLEKEKEYVSAVAVKEPLIAWTPTIATAGLAYHAHSDIPEWTNTLLVATMKGRSIRVLHLDDDGASINKESIFLQKHFGRIRDVAVATNGDIFFSTSNRDWHPRFQPWMYDGLPEGPDRILRIRKVKKGQKINPSLPIYQEEAEPFPLMDENWSFNVSEELETGAKLYAQYCLTCHGPEGKGADDLIPPLSQTDWVTGDKGRLIRIMLMGLSGEITVNGQIYNQEMPAYDYLSDTEIADLLTFIRNEFGNKSSAVIPGEVFEERKAFKRKD
jgi:glucose/arabinose dehydrogenase